MALPGRDHALDHLYGLLVAKHRKLFSPTATVIAGPDAYGTCLT